MSDKPKTCHYCHKPISEDEPTWYSLGLDRYWHDLCWDKDEDGDSDD